MAFSDRHELPRKSEDCSLRHQARRASWRARAHVPSFAFHDDFETSQRSAEQCAPLCPLLANSAAQQARSYAWLLDCDGRNRLSALTSLGSARREAGKLPQFGQWSCRIPRSPSLLELPSQTDLRKNVAPLRQPSSASPSHDAL